LVVALVIIQEYYQINKLFIIWYRFLNILNLKYFSIIIDDNDGRDCFGYYIFTLKIVMVSLYVSIYYNGNNECKYIV
jgi:hypothetical protein